MIKDLQHSELLADELYAKLPEDFKNECETNPHICTTAGELIIALRRLEELEELVEWYKSQDLIRREDAIAIFEDNFYRCHENSIKQIPKAEPPAKAIYSNKPIIVHNKEDWDRFQADISGCKTCKHDETGDGYCRDCGTTINHYEPYISKAESPKEGQ